jgi:hypothetical protein
LDELTQRKKRIFGAIGGEACRLVPRRSAGSDRVECTWEGVLLKSYHGFMNCTDKTSLPLRLWTIINDVLFALKLEIAVVNRTDIYRQAIKRTFADLYGVSPDTVDVSWTTGKTIVVQCAGKTFLHPILSDPDDDAPEFTCLEEDPVIVNLTDDERRRIELTV